MVKCLMNNSVCVLSSDYSVYYILLHVALYFQKQSPRCVLSKRSSKNMQQIYRGTLLLKCDLNLQSNFIEITLRHRCSPVNLLHIFKTPFSKNTSGWLLLYFNHQVPVLPPYRNQSIDLQSKLVDWFPYEGNTGT